MIIKPLGVKPVTFSPVKLQTQERMSCYLKTLNSMYLVSIVSFHSEYETLHVNFIATGYSKDPAEIKKCITHLHIQRKFSLQIRFLRIIIKSNYLRFERPRSQI